MECDDRAPRRRRRRELAVMHRSGGGRNSRSIRRGRSQPRCAAPQYRLRFNADSGLSAPHAPSGAGPCVPTLHCENRPMNMRPFPTAPASRSPAGSPPEYAEILTPEAMALRRQAAARVRRPPRRAARAPRASARREFDAGAAARFPARDARDPRRRLDLRADSRRHRRTAASRSPVRSTARWSSTRSTRARTCSWPTSRTRTRRSGTTTCRGRSTCATRYAAASTTRRPKARRTG